MILVWIMGHVLTGWDGSNPLVNPTNLCEYLRHNLYAQPNNIIYSLPDVSFGYVRKSSSPTRILVVSIGSHHMWLRVRFIFFNTVITWFSFAVADIFFGQFVFSFILDKHGLIPNLKVLTRIRYLCVYPHSPLGFADTNAPQIFYTNNATTINADTARVTAWVS